jgi:hypothetical protein
MELILTKTRTYNLSPYGNFYFVWGKKKVKRPNQIDVGSITIKHDTAMPLTPEQEKSVVSLMKKNKTDILTDGTHFYTRTNDGLTEIWHESIRKYNTDEAFRLAVHESAWRR